MGFIRFLLNFLQRPTAIARNARSTAGIPQCRRAFAAIALLALSALCAQAQTVFSFPGTISTGSSTSANSVAVTFTTPGAIASVRVFTGGIPQMDFTAGTGSATCTVGASFLAGQSCTLPVNFAPTAPGIRSGAIVLLDSGGLPLATQFLYGVAQGPIVVMVPGIMTTIAGNGSWLYNGDGGPATGANLFLPGGVVVDPAGNIYISDSSNNRIRKVTAATGAISTIAGNGIPGYTGDNGPATLAAINNPTGITMDGAGNIYFADSSNNVIRKVTVATGIITTIAGTGALGRAGNGGPATLAQLNAPNGLVFDAAGNLYIADTSNSLVRKVTPAGIISTFAGNGSYGFGGDGGAATSATMNWPWGLAFSTTGDLYIADLYNDRIRKVSTSGIMTTVAGTGSTSFSGDGGLATSANLITPAGVAVDPIGNLYIADSGNGRIRKVSALTSIISTIAGSGSQSMDGDATAATLAGLYGPYAITLDGAANLYIADMFHNRIRIVSSSQAWLTYPAMRVDRISAPLPQTLENDGNAPLSITSTLGVLNAAVDTASTTCVSGTPVAVGDSCIIGAEFAPTQIGKLVSGTIAITSNAVNSPATISVNGEVQNLDPTLTALTSSVNPASIGASITFTATVTLTSTGTIPTGTVKFMDGTTLLGTATLNSGAVATFSTSSLTVGPHTITAVYVGDANSSPSTSPAIIESLKQSTTLTLATSASPVSAGTAITFTATAIGASAVPTGAVIFQDGGTAIGTGTINGSGVATFTTSSLAAGPHTISAVYNGDTGSLPASPATISETVQAPTATTLASSANPSSIGAAITLTAAVTASGNTTSAGTLSGTITFTDGATTLGTGALNASGIAILKLSTLTIASHNITATYGGATYYVGSASTALVQVVQQATTSTLLSSSANPSIVNVSVTFTATVTGTGTTPTGVVSFKEGSTTLGQGTLNASGVATFTTSTLTAGAHLIVAAYAGDVNNVASASTSMTQTVNKATSVTSLVSTPNPSSQGVSVQFTAVVTSNGTLPTGTVLFQESGNTLGTATLGVNGVATWATTALTMGHHTIVAVYQGDTANNTSTSAVVQQNVLPQTTATLTSNHNPGVAGSPVTFTATVTGQGPVPTGNITFTDGATVLGTGVLNLQGTATLTVSSLSAGTHSIIANYGGDSSNASSTSATLVQTMQQATTQVSLGASAQTLPRGTAVTLTATVTGDGATPTGSATFMDGAQSLGSSILNGTGIATLVSSTITVGQHSLTAVYSGDTNDAASTSGVISLSITQASPSLQIAANTNPSLAGAATTFTATLLHGVATPTGTVSWFDGTVALGASVLNGSATSSFSTSSLTVGQHTITAVYSGDVNNTSVTSGAITQTVQQTTVTTVQSGANQSIAGAAVHLTATVVGGSGVTATGVVTFKDAALVIGTANLSGGTAALDVTTLTTGIHTITASYAGDTTSQSSISTPWTQTVVAATTGVTLTSSANPSVAGSAIVLTAHVTGNGQAATGSVTFKDGTATLGTATLASGVATFNTSALFAGLHSLTAVYNGDSDNQAATSAAVVQTVQQPTTTTLTSSTSPLLTQQSVTLTASVTNASGTSATGTVQFQDGTTPLGSAVLNAAGIASLSVASMSAGQHVLTASYDGDTLNISSISASITEPVQLRPTTTSIAASSSNVTAGQQLTLFAAVQSAGPIPATGIITFTSGSTTIGNANLAANGIATYTFAPSVGTYNIIATYAGDSVYAASVSASSGTISVTNTAQLTLTSNPPSVSVASKQYSVLAITMKSVAGFADTIKLGCLGLPSAATCTFSSDSVDLASASQQTVQLTLDTGSPLTAGGQASLHRPVSSSRMLACALPAGLFLGLLLWSARRNRRYLGGLLLLLLTTLTVGLSGCGALQINGTPPGTYTVVVTAQGMKTGITQSVNVTLTVTQ
jgi:hypothetical protein